MPVYCTLTIAESFSAIKSQLETGTHAQIVHLFNLLHSELLC